MSILLGDWSANEAGRNQKLIKGGGSGRRDTRRKISKEEVDSHTAVHLDARWRLDDPTSLPMAGQYRSEHGARWRRSHSEWEVDEGVSGDDERKRERETGREVHIHLPEKDAFTMDVI